MNKQQKAEVEFWTNLLNEVGEKDFIELRRQDYFDKTGKFPSFKEQQGKGLDFGSGLYSIFEFSDKDVVAYDPLMSEYNKLLKGNISTEFKGKFDWIFCVNVIDHTPKPEETIKEIYNLLKPDGRLYFEVNFDDTLSPAHYVIWNQAMVQEMFKDFKIEYIECERLDEFNQSRFWAEMICKN